jgi:hypothetical protein
MIEVQSATLLGIITILLTILLGVGWMLRLQVVTKQRVDTINGTLVRHEQMLETARLEVVRLAAIVRPVDEAARVNRALRANEEAHGQFVTVADCRHWHETKNEADKTHFMDLQRQLNEIKGALDKLLTRRVGGDD